MWYVDTPRYISTSSKRKLRNNTDVIDYFAGVNEIHEYRPKSAAVMDIDIDIADILGQKYRYRIDIGNCDINPSLLQIHLRPHVTLSFDLLTPNVDCFMPLHC